MILIDAPQMWGALNKRLGPSAHLISDLHGAAGTTELCAFAKRIGMNVSWIQKAGTPHEHFDVFGRLYQRAVECGARVVEGREFVKVFRAKRAAGAV